MPGLTDLPRSLVAAALAGTLALAGCSADDPEPASSASSSDAGAADAAADREDPQVVADAVNASLGVLVDEVVAALDAGLADDAMDDFPAFVDEWFPRTAEWVAWDTFASDTHAYAMLRTLIGMSVLAVGFSDDQQAAAEELRAELTAAPEWVTFEDGIAVVNDPEAEEAEGDLPIRLVERDGEWLFEGSTYDDAWFAEQGTTAEEALTS